MRVFYSSELDPHHPLALTCANRGLTLIQQSLLTFESIPSLPSHSFDIIFFSSPRAYQFGKHLQTPSSLRACFSKGTAKHISGDIAWQGSTPGKPVQTALDFKQWAGERRVLFPVSDRSLGSITKVFPSQQIEELVVYKTLLSPMPIDLCDVYIFTSPSNVASFFEANTLPREAKVVAWGESTKTALLQRKISPAYTQGAEDTVAWEVVLADLTNP